MPALWQPSCYSPRATARPLLCDLHSVISGGGANGGALRSDFLCFTLFAFYLYKAPQSQSQHTELIPHDDDCYTREPLVKRWTDPRPVRLSCSTASEPAVEKS